MGMKMGFFVCFCVFEEKKTEEVFLSKNFQGRNLLQNEETIKQAKMDYKQISGQKWDREVVCRTRLLARAAAVGTREGDEEDKRWRETWEEVAVSHTLGNSMTELSSSLSTSCSHSIALPRQFREELSSSVSGSRSLVFSFDNYWQNCHLLSLAHALAIALSLRSLWSVLDCTRFLFSRSQAFFFSVSLLTYLQIYAYSKFSLLWFVQDFMCSLGSCSLFFSCLQSKRFYILRAVKLLFCLPQGGEEVCTRSE